NDPARDTAHLVTTGRIVGWFDGRMEFGPRALGHRSILADPRTRGINEILNTRLHRSDFMPFAPSVLAERATEIFDVRGAKLAAEFMTITMNVRPAWRERVPAIVHMDNTARPQLVERGRNPHYYDVIQAFAEHTGIPLVLNTSFNIHEEPIVSSAEDALRSLRVGAVDCIVFNNKYLVRGEKSRA
ncbi:MAG TPA: carbamoyltransferase C-terminal domain-containing protein, partial [Candidatus Paceibacterota bacterium]